MRNFFSRLVGPAINSTCDRLTPKCIREFLDQRFICSPLVRRGRYSHFQEAIMFADDAIFARSGLCPDAQDAPVGMGRQSDHSLSPWK